MILTAGVLLFEDMSIEAGGLGLLSGALCGGGAAGILGTRPKKKKRRKKIGVPLLACAKRTG